VQDGQHVEVGDLLVVGAIDPKQVLRILGRVRCRCTWSARSRRSTASQGVSIHDKHIEVIVRQMLKRVTIIESATPSCCPVSSLSARFEDENRRVVAEGGTASGRPSGITKASLAIES
jgi:DNA-directed RNA polymerase subunit beta'